MTRTIARCSIAILTISAAMLVAAPASRLTRSLEGGRAHPVSGTANRQAQAQSDLGEADAALAMNDVTLFFRPSDIQQADLDQLLAEQQNPSSANFHRWLTPEAFADRFGLNNSDISRVSAWLAGQGLEVKTVARGHNWISFNGRADAIGRALHTSIHRYRVEGVEHYANATEASVPEALEEITAGFMGLDDFHPQPALRSFRPLPEPEYNSTNNRHFLAPQDFSTIYNVTPLAQAGYDGAAQGIVVVGQSAVTLSDIRTFRSRFGLPANDPHLLTYANDPGFNGAQVEGNLDIEWAGALAPRATIFYVYGPNAFTAAIASINSNLAPVISISYGLCEINIGVAAARGIFQQANAQGITVLNSSGDSGGASCDIQDAAPFASRGRYVSFPAALPEVTGVGGTQFNEGAGNYWAATNSAVLGSALTYIPEIAWNESDSFGLASTGGGASIFLGKPAWQSGPGVPADNARDVPDISLSAAGHDAYLIIFRGGLAAVAGTSASAPSLAGILALLNQYQIRQGFQASAGLGNINPQLYRLAQSAPAAFHDITEGTNIVNCLQGSPDCLTGSIGYKAGPGYDLATGLGTIDANALVKAWNQATSSVTLSINASPATVTLNDYVALYASLGPTDAGTPTGSIAFIVNSVPLSTVALSGNPLSASLLVPAYRLGVGLNTITATYSGDAAFGNSGASARVRVNLPAAGAGASAVTVTAPGSVFGYPPDAQGASWQFTIGLRERNGSPALLTGFSIDGVAQPLAATFPSPAIPAGATLTANLIIRNAKPGSTRTLGFTGTDATGVVWTREAVVTLLPVPGYLGGNASASPLTMQQNPAAAPGCQWSTQVTVDNPFGYRLELAGLFTDNINRSGDIVPLFGTKRIEAWGSISATLCFGNIKTPATSIVTVVYGDEFGDQFTQDLTVVFASPPATATTLGVAPASLSMSTALNVAIPPVQTLSINLSDRNQQWTASVFPANRTTAWLQLSQYSGTGPAQVSLQATGIGFGPGAYRATVIVTSPNSVPQAISVPVMFVNGAAAGTSISGAGNAFSLKPGAAPGMILAVYGSGLAGSTAQATTQPLPYSLGNVTAAINGVPTPVLYVSPGQLNVQVPYWVGAGPAVLGVNNDGRIAGYQFSISPSAPGILTDGKGVILPTSTAAQGGLATLYVTGTGEVNVSSLESGFAPTVGTTVPNLPRPVLPLSVTVDGTQALVQFSGSTPGVIGMTQVNIIVPSSTAPGSRPVVVTVGGASSPAANLDVTAAQPK